MPLYEASREPDMRPPLAVRIVCAKRDVASPARLLLCNGRPVTRERRGVQCPVYRCSCGDDVVIQTW